jgi:hypothetical protein
MASASRALRIQLTPELADMISEYINPCKRIKICTTHPDLSCGESPGECAYTIVPYCRYLLICERQEGFDEDEAYDLLDLPYECKCNPTNHRCCASLYSCWPPYCTTISHITHRWAMRFCDEYRRNMDTIWEYRITERNRKLNI